jgi:hypothetical protein
MPAKKRAKRKSATKSKNPQASALAKLRWKHTPAEERKAIAEKLADARWGKRRKIE